jgi:hypothetical protein
MSVSGRIARHLRANVVGYVAVFIALSGTAMALPGKKSVKSDDLAPAAVKAKAIKAAAVTNSKLAEGAVTSAKVADGALVSGDLANSAVTEPKLADDAVSRRTIVAGTINGGKLANGSVDSQKVNNGSLTAEDFAGGQLSDGFVFQNSTSPFTLPRAGRVFVIATLRSGCTIDPTPCTDTYFVSVDGTPVPNASAVRSGVDDSHITLVGITPQLTAGAHTIVLDNTAEGGAAETQMILSGILLQ